MARTRILIDSGPDLLVRVAPEGGHWLGSEKAGREAPHDADAPADHVDYRAGRCYELAAYALLLGTAPKGTRLVHGSIQGYGHPRINHAWLRLPDGRVWEPMRGAFYPSGADWTEYASAKVQRVYTRTEARQAVVVSGHWGPWHRTPTHQPHQEERHHG